MAFYFIVTWSKNAESDTKKGGSPARIDLHQADVRSRSIAWMKCQKRVWRALRYNDIQGRFGAPLTADRGAIRVSSTAVDRLFHRRRASMSGEDRVSHSAARS